MELWLTAMNCYHTAQGKPETLTPEEEQKFRVVDNLFQDAMISALYSKYEKNYISCTSGKELWDALEKSLEFLILAASCTSWSSCMTTKWFRTIL
jgi:hypothetical protein